MTTCKNCDAPLPGDCAEICALERFNLDHACTDAMFVLKLSIHEAAAKHSNDVWNAHRRAMSDMHKRHDQYVRRARVALLPPRQKTQRELALDLFNALGSPR